jgi:hypothetical protein
VEIAFWISKRLKELGMTKDELLVRSAEIEDELSLSSDNQNSRGRGLGRGTLFRILKGDTPTIKTVVKLERVLGKLTKRSDTIAYVADKCSLPDVKGCLLCAEIRKRADSRGPGDFYIALYMSVLNDKTLGSFSSYKNRHFLIKVCVCFPCYIKKKQIFEMTYSEIINFLLVDENITLKSLSQHLSSTPQILSKIRTNHSKSVSAELAMRLYDQLIIKVRHGHLFVKNYYPEDLIKKLERELLMRGSRFGEDLGPHSRLPERQKYARGKKVKIMKNDTRFIQSDSAVHFCADFVVRYCEYDNDNGFLGNEIDLPGKKPFVKHFNSSQIQKWQTVALFVMHKLTVQISNLDIRQLSIIASNCDASSFCIYSGDYDRMLCFDVGSLEESPTPEKFQNPLSFSYLDMKHRQFYLRVKSATHSYLTTFSKYTSDYLAYKTIFSKEETQMAYLLLVADELELISANYKFTSGLIEGVSVSPVDILHLILSHESASEVGRKLMEERFLRLPKQIPRIKKLIDMLNA